MQRFYKFEQVFNVRDAGGYPTASGKNIRWKRIFRSAEHQRMSEVELRNFQSEVGIRTVIDFRSSGEANDPRGVGAISDAATKRYHFPMGDADSKYKSKRTGTWAPDYIGLLENQKDKWLEALNVVADSESYPVLFHCVTGKDRTGVFAVLLLGILNVSDADILSDYELSSRGMNDLIRNLRYRGVIDENEAPNPGLGVDASAMALAVEHIHTVYGGYREYARDCGAVDKLFKQLERLLLE
ncbi:MAG: tyrosine-protein phosphatase [Chloroflexota bacterium]|nr:tyrosine-protein phosphatase [Chloroflexota bacterium]